MKIEDIRHRATVKSILKHNLNIESFETVEEIRKQISRIKCGIYRKNNKDYFRDYMYERAVASRNLESLNELPRC